MPAGPLLPGHCCYSPRTILTLNSPPAVGWAQASSASAPPAGWAGEVEPHTLKPLVVFQQTLPTPALWPALCQAGARGAKEGDPGLLESGGGLDTNAAVLVPWGTFWEWGRKSADPTSGGKGV